MIKKALALANHPMKDYIRVGFTTTRQNREAFDSFCKVADVAEWKQMADADGESFDVTAITWEAFAHGGYEIHYLTADCGVIFHTCANANTDKTLSQEGDEGFDPQWAIVTADINYESNGITCDHCGREIEPAFEVES